jgi:hypothetical protein
MLFYRSPSSTSGRGPAVGTMRVLTLLALLAYPFGCILLETRQTSATGLQTILGFAFVALSLLAAISILGSPLQRIVGEEARKLDERELQLRHRSLSRAYALFTGMTLIAFLYFAFASEAQWWHPQRYDEYHAIFWGVLLYASILPTTLLAWQERTAPETDD